MEELGELVKEIERIYAKQELNKMDLKRLLKKCRKVRRSLSHF